MATTTAATAEVLAAVTNATDLRALCTALRALPRADAAGNEIDHDAIGLDLTSLPTFGAGAPSDTSNVWSWDATHLLRYDLTGSRGWHLVERAVPAPDAHETECVYCGRDVETAREDAPAPSIADDAEWTRLGEQHSPDCEWIVTRAHRL